MLIVSVVAILTATEPARAEEGEGAPLTSALAGGILTATTATFADPDLLSQPDPDPLPSPKEAESAEQLLQAGPQPGPEPTWLETFIKNWAGEVKLGTDLSFGTVDRTRVRGGFNLNKDFGPHKTSVLTDYAYAETNKVESENRLVSSLNQDWATSGTDFSGIFLRAAGEMDEFRSYDCRLSLAGGGRYQILKDERTDALIRVGMSATREFGGPRDEWIPEGAVFFAATRALSTKQKLIASVDYFPELEEPDEYRLTARAAWEITLDDEAGLSLRLGAENRYDSRVPETSDRNDLDIRAELVWRF